MTTTTTKSFHHGNLHQALIKAAVELLDESGLDKVTIRSIARETGVSHAAPVNHFRNRQMLLTEMSELFFKQLLEQTISGLASSGSGLASRIKAFANSVLCYALKYPHRYRLLWRQELNDYNNEALNVARDAIYGKLITELSSEIDTNHFEIDTFAIALWAMCHGYVSLRLDGNLAEGVDALYGKTRLDAMIESYLASFG